MAHFIQVTDNQCGDVIVISNDDIDNLPFPESEPIGQAFIASLGLEGLWLQTSYSGSFRGCYAGPDYSYNPDVLPFGEFVPPPVAPAS
jgi:hypothetical protein